VVVAAAHRPLLVPRAEIPARLERLRGGLRAAGVAVAWIDHLTDRLYFTGSMQDGVLLVPAEGPAAYFVRKSAERAAAESPLEVREWPGRRGLVEEVRRRLPSGSRLGLAFDVATAATYRSLCEVAAPDDIAAAIRTIRSVKSGWEIDQVRGAARQATALYEEIVPQIRTGMTELELTGVVEGRLRALGHGGTIRVRRRASDVVVAVVVSGPSALYPTAFDGCVGGEGAAPGMPAGGGFRRLAAGHTLMLDVVTCHNGYLADTTRTYFLGPAAPSAVREAHDACRVVLSHIERLVRPGARCSDVWRAARRFVDESGEPAGFMGCGENRVRFLGHGVGLELDELPVLADKLEQALEPGMVIAIEPKAFLDPVGPVGVENTYVVTERGCESLCSVPDHLHLLG
jgi:Xaa-Pro aminopeptidase